MTRRRAPGSVRALSLPKTGSPSSSAFGGAPSNLLPRRVVVSDVDDVGTERLGERRDHPVPCHAQASVECDDPCPSACDLGDERLEAKLNLAGDKGVARLRVVRHG